MENTFEVTLERLDGYRFHTEFGGTELPPLVVDEPPPLGAGSGPNPSRLLATAIGSCLSASLLFCLEKSRVMVRSIRTQVVGTMRR
ncbi:MAG: OsmC family protein, partial [Myxococcales bacterium]|nr:OsmC family protein [Myxococcales bacterium]